MLKFYNHHAYHATFHCLIGCGIGEILGMVLGVILGLSNMFTIILAVFLAFLFGFSLTFWSMRKYNMKVKDKITTTVKIDVVSISSMEIIDNLIILLIPGALNTHLDHPLFWISLFVALFIAFWCTVPVNGWLISKNKGHALMHH